MLTVNVEWHNIYVRLGNIHWSSVHTVHLMCYFCKAVITVEFIPQGYKSLI